MLAQPQTLERNAGAAMSGPDLGLLIRRAREGDHRAFAELHDLNRDRIYALCLRMSADPDLALTLTQDAFVRAWRRLGTFRGDSRFSTWLHRLAVNVVLDELGRRRRRAARETSLDFFADDFDSVAPSIQPSRTGDRLDLERAIAALPPGARNAFVLHDVEGYKMREIAELSGSALGTIKAQLHRARRLLREALSC